MKKSPPFLFIPIIFSLALVILIIIPSLGYGFAFTSHESFSVSSVNAVDHGLVETDGAGYYREIQQPLRDLLPDEVDMDALDFIDPTTIVFSLREDAHLAGPGQVADEDLLLYNGSTISLLFDGSSAGVLPPETDIDAVDVIALSPLEFSFSLREGASLTGIGQTSRNDAVRFVSGYGMVSTDFNGTGAGIPPETNLDGFSRPNGTDYVLSFNAAINLTGTEYDDADLITYSGGIYSSFFDASAYSIPGEVNIQDIEAEGSAVPVELSGFEAN